MSETRAVTLETQVDTTGARAGFTEITREAGAMAQAVARVSQQADRAVGEIGANATSSARNVDAAQRNMVASIQRATAEGQRAAAAMEAGARSTSRFFEVLAGYRGVDPQTLAPYLAQLRAVEEVQARVAQSASAQQDAQQRAAAAAEALGAAQREAMQANVSRDAFLNGLREQIALFGRSTEEVLQYRAAQLGAANAADPLIAQLRTLREAQEQAAASALVMERAQREASQVNTSRDAFLNGLREEIALFGRSAEEVQVYRAAQLNAANAAGPLLAQLRSLREAEEQAAVAARAMEQAQREALQMDTSRDAFLNSLREQIALFGRSAEAALQYRAAQIGAANAAEPLIEQLRALRTAQEQANQAGRDQAGRDAFVSNLREQADAIGRTRTELIELRAAQLGVTQQAAPFIARLREAEQGMRGNEISAAQTAAALRMVPAQMTDIVVSLQSGQAPMTVLLQQGGQLKDMFGGAGAAAKALGGYVLGLVNPYTVAAAAAVGLAYAYKVGHDEYIEYARSLALTGNIIGATTGQMGDMARRIGEISGSQHEAAAALVAITNAGGVALENLERFGTEAVEAQRVFGKSVADTANELAELGKAPLSALDKINEKYHFITAATYAQVKALQDHGESIKAASVAQQAYIDGIATQRQKVLDSLTDWERGWIRIKKAASGAVDAVIDFATGREATGNEKIKTLLTERETIEGRIEQLKKRGKARDGEKYDPTRDADVLAAEAALDANKREINSIREKDDVKKKAAAEEGKAARADELRNKWLGESNILLTRQQQLQRDLDAARTEGAANGLSEEEIQNRLTVVRRKYNDVYVTGIDTSIAALRRRADVENEVDQRKLAAIAAQRAAGSITEEDAIQRSAEVELGILDRQKRTLQGQLDLTRSKLNSSAQQADLDGQIAVAKERRLTREKQLTNDLIALDRERFEVSAKIVEASYDQAASDRNSLRAQVRDQRDYNAQIGLTAEELLKLSAARLMEQAARKDQEADIAEGLDLTGELAARYREQAAALRDRAAAEREGFVKSRDPYVNLSISLNRYVEESKNAGGMIGDALTNAFRSAEDAFATFVTTGKLSFRDLATSIIADFARMQAKAAIGSFASSLLGSMGTDTTSGWGATLLKSLGGARANGGPVNAGVSYLVGERGPEIFTPSSSGGITPNHMIGAGNGSPITIQTNVQVTPSGTTSSTTGDQGAYGKALADMMASTAREVIARESRQGGLLWKMRMGR